MYRFLLNDSKEVIEFADEWNETMRGNQNWIGRHEITSLNHANELAAAAEKLTGFAFIGIDNGECVWPRFDVARRPAVGDEVSYAFNGDYYPCGKVAKISDSLRLITTDGGMKFYRRRNSGSWLNRGTWSLVQGHISRLNPEF
jgi:hypothetical protein